LSVPTREVNKKAFLEYLAPLNFMLVLARSVSPCPQASVTSICALPSKGLPSATGQ
jgi:hypothetical protein